MVASDRISAFDVVLPTLIPDKGRVLTGLSVHWFHQLDTPNHLLSTDLEGVDGLAGLTDEEWEGLRGRSMVVRGSGSCGEFLISTFPLSAFGASRANTNR